MSYSVSQCVRTLNLRFVFWAVVLLHDEDHVTFIHLDGNNLEKLKY